MRFEDCWATSPVGPMRRKYGEIRPTAMSTISLGPVSNMSIAISATINQGGKYAVSTDSQVSLAFRSIIRHVEH